MGETGSPQLDWYEVGQTGANFARHFGARVSGGGLVASVFECPGRAGIGLTFVPTTVARTLNWAAVTCLGASFACHFRAVVSGRTLIASLLGGVEAPPGGGRADLGLALTPAATCRSLNWVSVDTHGATFARHFAAAVPGGTLVASVAEGAERGGVGLAFIPAAVSAPLRWGSVPSQGADFASHFKADVAGGSLIASTLEGNEKTGLGLAFAPVAAAGRLNWEPVKSQGASFARHYGTRLRDGMLIASVLEGAGKAGVGLTFIPR